ncbi:DUF1801 domain-containing protein [Altererythrobacter salegens]|uniref:DUF1801 domain-containing protein n=1 Tax=Croceibacterium salegens TaxID=1737568 RepID=A0A6I4SVG4_9SPHN|nr:DUF1801 domain-containing protein [Croceibacterium salegens]MXO59050.1 DUF1801 domain-containing protein [Croceibacterium salegens]
MTVEQEIEDYVASLPAAKQDDLRRLHATIQAIAPGCSLWLLDGKDESGKVVSNPNIGYGRLEIRYANGTSKPFYRVGTSANTSGLSIYVMGLDDRKYLAEAFGGRLGKAAVTGYCVKFRALADLDMGVLEELLRFGMADRENAD